MKHFRTARGINVPRTRFIPIKQTSDLMLLRSNIYRLEEGRPVLAPERKSRAVPIPTIKLGDRFKKVRKGNFCTTKLLTVKHSWRTLNVAAHICLTSCRLIILVLKATYTLGVIWLFLEMLTVRVECFVWKYTYFSLVSAGNGETLRIPDGTNINGDGINASRSKRSQERRE